MKLKIKQKQNISLIKEIFENLVLRIPKVKQIKDNLVKPEPEKIVSLNFRVSSDFKRDFKIASATVNMTQSDLLQKIFRHWEKTKG